MGERVAGWVVRWRWWIIAATLGAVAVAASGASRIQFSNDYRVFFSKQNPQLEAFEALQNIYGKDDNVLFVLAPKDGKVFTRETLATIEWLTKEAWTLPYSTRVDSVTNFQHTRAEGDDLVVANLVAHARSLSDADLDRIQRIALAEPLLADRLISPRAHVTGVNVRITLPDRAMTEEQQVVDAVRALARQIEARNPNLEVRLTGMVLMNHAFAEFAQKDLQTLVPAMYAIIVLITFLALRSVAGTLATVLVIAFSVVTAMGLMGWLGIKLTPPTATAPTVILTLAIADSIHILLTVIHGMRRGLNKRDAIVESLRINWQAVFLTSLTTVIGFLSMNFSEVPPFRDLGNVVAMGVAAAWVYSVLFLPALVAVLPLRVKPASAGATLAMDRLGDFVVARRTPLLWGMAGLTLVLIAFIPRNELNDQFVEYFDETVDFRTATDFSVANLTGIYQIDYSLPAGESGGITNPAYLADLEAFAAWYRTQPGVMHVTTLTDTMKRLNKNLHADDAAWYRVPESRELAAQYLLLYELSLPFGLDLNNQINVDKSATRMTVILENLTSNQILALEASAQQWLRDHAPPAMLAHGTGPSVMFAYIGQRNIRSMIGGNIAALVLVSAVMIVAIRSLKVGLISLLPNLVPIGMAFGLWGMLVGQVGLSLSVVTSLTFGIVVDDTIHFLTKYLRARREEGMTPADAVRYAYHTVGTAMWVTSLILAGGFLVLALSSFELNHGMGILSAVTIAFALAADYFMLPPLLMKLEERHAPSARPARKSVSVVP